MDMVGLVSGVACYGIAKVVSGKVIKDSKERRFFHGVTFTVLFLGLFAAASFLVNPMIRPTLAVNSLESSLADHPAISALKDTYPEAYGELLVRFKDAIRQDPFASTDDVTALANAESAAISFAGSRLSHASNEAAVGFHQRQIKAMALLNNFGECYHFMNRPAEDALSFVVHLSSDDWLELQKSAAAVLISSATSPQAIPGDAEVQPYLQPAIEMVARKYGDEFARLTKKDMTDAEKKKYCTISVDMFGEILKQPPAQAGQALRFLSKSAT